MEVARPFWSEPMLVIRTMIRLPIDGRQRVGPLKAQVRRYGGIPQVWHRVPILSPCEWIMVAAET